MYIVVLCINIYELEKHLKDIGNKKVYTTKTSLQKNGPKVPPTMEFQNK